MCDRIFTSSDITVWESYFMSLLICLWPHRCRPCLCAQSEGHIKTQQRILMPQFGHAPMYARLMHSRVQTCTPTHIVVHSGVCKAGRHEGSLTEIGAAQEGSGTHPWIWTGSSQEKRTLAGCRFTHSGNQSSMSPNIRNIRTYDSIRKMWTYSCVLR